MQQKRGSTNKDDKQKQNGGGAESDASDWVSAFFLKNLKEK